MWLDGFFFSGSIPPVFAHKVRCHQQRFGKMTATAGLDKYKKLLWTRLQWHQSCHSNEMASSSILLAAVFLGIGTFFSNIVHRSFFLQLPPPMFAKFERNMWERYRDILELKSLFLVWNTVKLDNLDLRPLSLQTGECGLRRCKTFHN